MLAIKFSLPFGLFIITGILGAIINPPNYQHKHRKDVQNTLSSQRWDQNRNNYDTAAKNRTIKTDNGNAYKKDATMKPKSFYTNRKEDIISLISSKNLRNKIVKKRKVATIHYRNFHRNGKNVSFMTTEDLKIRVHYERALDKLKGGRKSFTKRLVKNSHGLRLSDVLQSEINRRTIRPPSDETTSLKDLHLPGRTRQEQKNTRTTYKNNGESTHKHVSQKYAIKRHAFGAKQNKLSFKRNFKPSKVAWDRRIPRDIGVISGTKNNKGNIHQRTLKRSAFIRFAVKPQAFPLNAHSKSSEGLRDSRRYPRDVRDILKVSRKIPRVLGIWDSSVKYKTGLDSGDVSKLVNYSQTKDNVISTKRLSRSITQEMPERSESSSINTPILSAYTPKNSFYRRSSTALIRELPPGVVLKSLKQFPSTLPGTRYYIPLTSTHDQMKKPQTRSTQESQSESAIVSVQQKSQLLTSVPSTQVTKSSIEPTSISQLRVHSTSILNIWLSSSSVSPKLKIKCSKPSQSKSTLRLESQGTPPLKYDLSSSPSIGHEKTLESLSQSQGQVKSQGTAPTLKYDLSSSPSIGHEKTFESLSKSQGQVQSQGTAPTLKYDLSSSPSIGHEKTFESLSQSKGQVQSQGTAPTLKLELFSSPSIGYERTFALLSQGQPVTQHLQETPQIPLASSIKLEPPSKSTWMGQSQGKSQTQHSQQTPQLTLASSLYPSIKWKPQSKVQSQMHQSHETPPLKSTPLSWILSQSQSQVESSKMSTQTSRIQIVNESSLPLESNSLPRKSLLTPLSAAKSSSKSFILSSQSSSSTLSLRSFSSTPSLPLKSNSHFSLQRESSSSSSSLYLTISPSCSSGAKSSSSSTTIKKSTALLSSSFSSTTSLPNSYFSSQIKSSFSSSSNLSSPSLESAYYLLKSSSLSSTSLSSSSMMSSKQMSSPTSILLPHSFSSKVILLDSPPDSQVIASSSLSSTLSPTSLSLSSLQPSKPMSSPPSILLPYSLSSEMISLDSPPNSPTVASSSVSSSLFPSATDSVNTVTSEPPSTIIDQFHTDNKQSLSSFQLQTFTLNPSFTTANHSVKTTSQSSSSIIHLSHYQPSLSLSLNNKFKPNRSTTDLNATATKPTIDLSQNSSWLFQSVNLLSTDVYNIVRKNTIDISKNPSLLFPSGKSTSNLLSTDVNKRESEVPSVLLIDTLTEHVFSTNAIKKTVSLSTANNLSQNPSQSFLLHKSTLTEQIPKSSWYAGSISEQTKKVRHSVSTSLEHMPSSVNIRYLGSLSEEASKVRPSISTFSKDTRNSVPLRDISSLHKKATKGLIRSPSLQSSIEHIRSSIPPNYIKFKTTKAVRKTSPSFSTTSSKRMHHIVPSRDISTTSPVVSRPAVKTPKHGNQYSKTGKKGRTQNVMTKVTRKSSSTKVMAFYITPSPTTTQVFPSTTRVADRNLSTTAGDESAGPTSAEPDDKIMLFIIVATIPTVLLLLLIAILLARRARDKGSREPFFKIQVEYNDKPRRPRSNSRLDLTINGMQIDVEYDSTPTNDKRSSNASFKADTEQVRELHKLSQECKENLVRLHEMLERELEPSLHSEPPSPTHNSKLACNRNSDYSSCSELEKGSNESSEKELRRNKYEKWENPDSDEAFLSNTDEEVLSNDLGDFIDSVFSDVNDPERTNSTPVKNMKTSTLLMSASLGKTNNVARSNTEHPKPAPRSNSKQAGKELASKINNCSSAVSVKPVPKNRARCAAETIKKRDKPIAVRRKTEVPGSVKNREKPTANRRKPEVPKKVTVNKADNEAKAKPPIPKKPEGLVIKITNRTGKDDKKQTAIKTKKLSKNFSCDKV